MTKTFEIMAKFIRHDYGAIHEALNKMIIAEVKAALELVPQQMYETPSMCRIVVSDGNDYEPKDVAVDMIWLHKGKLYFDGHIMPLPEDDNDDPKRFEGGEADEDMAETDWLDITDFAYLIDQIAEQVESDETVNIANKSFETNGWVVAEFTLRTAAQKTI